MPIPNEDVIDVHTTEAVGPCAETCKKCGAQAEWFDGREGLFIGCSNKDVEGINCTWRFSGQEN